jgi:hypothetical protein
MSNVGYIIAAYAITLGALTVYGFYLWSRLRLLEQEVSSLTSGERQPYGHQ